MKYFTVVKFKPMNLQIFGPLFDVAVLILITKKPMKIPKPIMLGLLTKQQCWYVKK